MDFERDRSRDPLSAVRAGLSEEFANLVDLTIIERVASEEVAAFADARVRDFVAILAIGRGRARLRQSANRLRVDQIRIEETN
jgi:hypothetical protein